MPTNIIYLGLIIPPSTPQISTVVVMYSHDKHTPLTMKVTSKPEWGLVRRSWAHGREGYVRPQPTELAPFGDGGVALKAETHCPRPEDLSPEGYFRRNQYSKWGARDRDHSCSSFVNRLSKSIGPALELSTQSRRNVPPLKRSIASRSVSYS